ncbi:hypothetical protein K503DRAFT_375730 [Rhizopogon vinicolor AM-OR11-026]|uniref:Uncharacterized protein n=1 Tax=Rhizopogon vinicolor AM-OR11-026 TaxID=1314800 RepID=A0A1B7NBM7_9AGAM|nr:hypothetical protein K503DRAFT_375730 [Rhizopogon vinicolor AM-OR11-026]
MEPVQLSASASLSQVYEGPQSLTGSASFQSYLYSAGSYHRHAKGANVYLEKGQSLVHVGSQSPRFQSVPVEASLHSGPLSGIGRFMTNFPEFLLEDLHRFRRHLGGLYLFWSLYCCVSVFFFSFKMHSALQDAVAAGRLQPNHVSNAYHVSPLTNISVRQRMSISFPNIPLSGHLETFTLSTHSSANTDFTACLWIEEEKLDTLATLTAWPGPMSVVIVISAQSGSTGHPATLKRLLGLIDLLDTHASSGLLLHVLQVSSSSGGSPNAYLNFARLLAPTDRVALFPDGLPSHLSNNLYSSIVRSTSPLPLVLGNDSRRIYPFAPMSPVVLLKDYPAWCTERFSLFRSRSLDWEDCLWQLWFESGGEVKSVAVDGWPGREAGILNSSNNSVISAKINRRWTIKYREEACALAVKRSQALETAGYADKKAFQWQKFCHEFLGTATPNVT